ncbi:hypothetical protein LOTGIDRAFT_228332 [Lottia gigantea]|uniref:EGF-like domain-containing protein n=1 Tax=Lottia gigantea TaxID=225164 RepID=V4AKU8_LOTGI|nr:hypothetical protein LOTGIDRAFT_228332 [Lottia gigantea]ESO97762.1 hypothetical protein LOTGIDRAFT_228332 [Lottia gigantea]
MRIWISLFGIGIVLINYNRVRGQPCQGAVCVPNASCVDNECRCDPGFTGEGRFLCEPTATRCVCAAYGDPHTIQYDTMNRATTQLLPCNYVYSIYATAGGCLITAVVETMERPGEPYKSFVSRTAITVLLGGVSQTVYLSGAGVQSNASNIIVTDTSVPGTVSIDIPQCLTKANFKPFGATAISAPKVGSGFLPNLCGNCDGMRNDIPPIFAAQPTRQERDIAFSLRNLANQQAATPEGSICTNLKASVALPNCASDAQLARATSVQNGCGAIFPNEVFLQCATTASLPSTAVYGAYRNCLNLYCSGNTAGACVIVAQLYAGLSCTPPPGYTCP